MKKVLFIDRDGTILEEPADEQVDTLEKLRFLPYSISGLKKVQDWGYTLVMVSNQDGLGTDSFPEPAFRLVQDKMMDILSGEGIHFEKVFIDSHFPADQHPNRKPGIGMLKEFLTMDIDLSKSWVIGDRYTDVRLAANIGCKALWILQEHHLPQTNPEFGTQREKEHLELPFHRVNSWGQILDFLGTENLEPKKSVEGRKKDRLAIITRNTNETQINLMLNLDGKGVYSIDTGIKFYDHMLEQLSRHSGMDIHLTVKGDLEIDEHHTIEDSAIALGQGMREAMGDKKGMERYGFLLPMDEALVRCALDFSGRSYFIFKGHFDREYVGDFPTEMLEHWMKSFSDHAGLNLNLEILEGSNTHHKVEASFKALARSIKQALKLEGDQLASTKGIL